VNPFDNSVQDFIEISETENKKITCPYGKLIVILKNLTNTEEELTFNLPQCELYTIDMDFSQKVTIIKSDKQGLRFEGVPSKEHKSGLNQSRLKNSSVYLTKTTEGAFVQASATGLVPDTEALTANNTNINSITHSWTQGPATIEIQTYPERHESKSKVKFSDAPEKRVYYNVGGAESNVHNGLNLNKNKKPAEPQNQNMFSSYTSGFNYYNPSNYLSSGENSTLNINMSSSAASNQSPTETNYFKTDTDTENFINYLFKKNPTTSATSTNDPYETTNKYSTKSQSYLETLLSNYNYNSVGEQNNYISNSSYNGVLNAPSTVSSGNAYISKYYSGSNNANEATSSSSGNNYPLYSSKTYEGNNKRSYNFNSNSEQEVKSSNNANAAQVGSSSATLIETSANPVYSSSTYTNKTENDFDINKYLKDLNLNSSTTITTTIVSNGETQNENTIITEKPSLTQNGSIPTKTLTKYKAGSEYEHRTLDNQYTAPTYNSIDNATPFSTITVASDSNNAKTDFNIDEVTNILNRYNLNSRKYYNTSEFNNSTVADNVKIITPRNQNTVFSYDNYVLNTAAEASLGRNTNLTSVESNKKVPVSANAYTPSVTEENTISKSSNPYTQTVTLENTIPVNANSYTPCTVTQEYTIPVSTYTYTPIVTLENPIPASTNTYTQTVTLENIIPVSANTNTPTVIEENRISASVNTYNPTFTEENPISVSANTYKPTVTEENHIPVSTITYTPIVTLENTIPVSTNTYRPSVTVENTIPASTYTYTPIVTLENTIPTSNYTYIPSVTLENTIPSSIYTYTPTVTLENEFPKTLVTFNLDEYIKNIIKDYQSAPALVTSDTEQKTEVKQTFVQQGQYDIVAASESTNRASVDSPVYGVDSIIQVNSQVQQVENNLGKPNESTQELIVEEKLQAEEKLDPQANLNDINNIEVSLSQTAVQQKDAETEKEEFDANKNGANQYIDYNSTIIDTLGLIKVESENQFETTVNQEIKTEKEKETVDNVPSASQSVSNTISKYTSPNIALKRHGTIDIDMNHIKLDSIPFERHCSIVSNGETVSRKVSRKSTADKIKSPELKSSSQTLGAVEEFQLPSTINKKQNLALNFEKIKAFYSSIKDFKKTILSIISENNELNHSVDLISNEAENEINLKNNSSKTVFVRVSGQSEDQEEVIAVKPNKSVNFRRLTNKIYNMQIGLSSSSRKGALFNVFSGCTYAVDSNLQLTDSLGNVIALSFSEAQASNYNNKYFAFLKEQNFNSETYKKLVNKNYICFVNGASETVSIRIKADENSDANLQSVYPAMALFVERKPELQFLAEIKTSTSQRIIKYILQSNNVYILDEELSLVKASNGNELVEAEKQSSRLTSNSNKRQLSEISKKIVKEKDGEDIYFKFEETEFDEENLNEFNIENRSEKNIHFRIELREEGSDAFFLLKAGQDVWILREDALFLCEVVGADLTSKRYYIHTNYCYFVDNEFNLVESTSQKLLPTTLEKFAGNNQLVCGNFKAKINYNADIKAENEEVEDHDEAELAYFKDIKPKFSRGKKFIDDAFPAKANSLTAVNAMNKKRLVGNNPHSNEIIDENLLSCIAFKRPEEIFKNPTQSMSLFNENSNNSETVYQTYLASILACLKQNPALIRRCFKSQEVSKDGFYEVYFYENGARKVIFIDDQLPVLTKEPEELNSDKVYFSEPKSSEIWLALLEKAYAKYEGGYANIQDGNVLSEIYFFTGALSYKFSTKDLSQTAIWDNLLAITNTSAFVLSGIDEIEGNSNTKESFCQKTYTVLNAYEFDNGNEIIKLVKVENTSGPIEWLGHYSQNSEKWTAELNNFVDADGAFKESGVFFLSFDEFVDQFDFFVVTFAN